MEKASRKWAPKASPRPIFYFGKQHKTAIACKNFFKKWGILKKPLKKLTLFCLLNPIPFNGHSYQKQKEPGTSYHLLFRLQSNFTKII